MDLAHIPLGGNILHLTWLVMLVTRVSAKAVFSHFMMANTANYESHDWERDMTLAQEAHIDAFALNMAYSVGAHENTIETAFQVAEKQNFQLFFSFDYVGNGSWPQADVLHLLQKYSSSSAHYRHNNKPFVSTFEGFDNADDWKEIKNKTKCFFVPDWSSVGAKAALQLADGVADGLFSWAAWPSGGGKMNTLEDAAFIDSLKAADKPYMMPISPWFFADMPFYGKNFSFHGGSLWNERWVEVFYIDPEWVEIISWNDYGESHYIGPLNEKGFQLFDADKGSYNYARGMPHDGWRLQLPFAIDVYKNGTASVKQESLVMWYRTQSESACGNKSSVDDDLKKAGAHKNQIFFSALLGSNASIKATFGDMEKHASWSYKPDGGVGIYYGSTDIHPNNFEDAVVAVLRDGEEFIKVKGPSLNDSCADSFVNFNAWVGGGTANANTKAFPERPLSEQVCIQGSGPANFSELCQFTCSYGYCPIENCYCTAMGAPRNKPSPTKQKGYPKDGDGRYLGLCSFACYYGFCPTSACKSNGTSTAALPTSAACTETGSARNAHDSKCPPHTKETDNEATSVRQSPVVCSISLMFLVMSVIIL